MNSTMFLNDLTIVDHAFIDDTGMVVGGSFNPSFLVTGKVDEQEQVVVDFSKIKKEIKTLIDHAETGFDHKLWISRTWSNLVSVTELENNRLQIVTPHHTMQLPADAVRWFEFTSYDDNHIGEHFAEYLTLELDKKYPGIEVVCNNSCYPHIIRATAPGTKLTPPMPIRYFHGLKHSTSFGCRNLFHGHLSFIQLQCDDGADNETVIELMRTINNEWDFCMYVYNANLRDKNVVAYTTEGRGYFEDVFSEQVKHKIFDTETTIENLVAQLVKQHKEELLAAKVTAVFFSEGLSKGAVEFV